MATISKNLTVAAKSAYTLTINVIPTGSSVTPVNDIQTWLHCADIWDKTYTTINQVLADASTLQALIASTNAVDYMARSTSWASSVTANSNAMTYIGNNNYCANKLLANTTWRNAICNSAYFESVLNVKVPTMTSNTTPYGEASADSSYSGRPAWHAFDNNATTFWAANNDAASHYIAYRFINPICVKRMDMQSNRVLTMRVFGSNDGSNYKSIGNFNVSTSGVLNTFDLNNDNYYLYYKVTVLTWSDQPYQIQTLQFYGRA